MKYNVRTSGMGCAHCIAKMTKAMNAMGAQIDRMELNDFDIEFDGEASAIKETVEKLGFEFVSAEAK